ncbi:MAG TPA: outer membrane beta-barrel protein [Bacteroidia bacterium]|nr:outer membrane beta-barrel protein [Bacteroidia bacterium]
MKTKATISFYVACSICLRLTGQVDTAIYSDLKDTQKGEPLEDMDCSWWNGGDRRSTPTLNGKYFTPTVMMDANYTHSFNDPIDNTVVGSTALARNNEMQVSAAHLGGDFYFDGARAHIVTQFGTRSTVVPRNDGSPYKGQYQLADVYRYLAEANAGYHFRALYGINVDAGMFMSYIGLNSYYQVENWEYQASFTSDNTPWFFNGIRVQIFATKKLKIEPWIINGWQSYGMFNHQPGVGGNVTWCPNENMKILTNDYYGADAAGIPSRKRFHSDNSLLMRYFNRPGSRKISQMAFSLTTDIGFEKGGGVNGLMNGDSIHGPAQYFASVMFYNRTWFARNKFAWTFGGGYMSNPGRYLLLYPTGQASPLPNPNNPTSSAGAFPYNANPGDKFEGFDCSTNIDWLPNEHVCFRLEYVHRQSSVPYFAGHGGVTSPTGYTTSPLTPDWRPDLVKSEDRVILAVLFRL